MAHDLRIYADGLAFKNGEYDLRTLECIFTNYRKILDTLVSVSLGKKSCSNDLKKQLNYNVTVKDGSIALLIDFVIENRENFTIMFADGGATISSTVVRLFESAIYLREKCAEIAESGIPISLKIENAFNFTYQKNSFVVNADSNTGNISINDPRILLAANETRAPVNNILGQVDGERVEFVELGLGQRTRDDNAVRLSPSQRPIIGSKKEKLPDTFSIIGRLDMVSFSNHKGAIVSDGQRFSVSWEESIRDKIQRVADVDGIKFKVKAIIDRMNLDGSTIGFHVMDCTVPQVKMDI